jgi:hypothetical protein
MGIALVASGLLVRTKGQMRTRTAKPVPAYWSARLDGVVVRVLSARPHGASRCHSPLVEIRLRWLITHKIRATVRVDLGLGGTLQRHGGPFSQTLSLLR